MSALRNEKGFIRGFFLLVLFVGLCVVGVFFAKPFIHYNTLRSHTKDILMMEIGNTDEIKSKIMADAAELHIPLQESNLSVTHQGPQGKVIRVNAKWSETVDFWGYYQKRLDFEINEDF